MLHTEFRENRPAGSGEDFLRVLTIYGRGALVPEKKIFEGFLPYMGMEAILVM